MVQNILSDMKCERLYRLDVNFKIQDRSLATLIGRTAHILMIECKAFYLNLIYRYRDVFCEWNEIQTLIEILIGKNASEKYKHSSSRLTEAHKLQ